MTHHRTEKKFSSGVIASAPAAAKLIAMAAGTALALAAAQSTRADTIPISPATTYSDNFSADNPGAAANAAVNFSGTGAFAVSSGAYVGSLTPTSSVSVTGSSVYNTSLGGSSTMSFSESATFTLDAGYIGQGTNGRVGLTALGNVSSQVAAPNNSSTNYYLADVTGSGGMRIVVGNPGIPSENGAIVATGSFIGGALTTGTAYTETLSGQYTGLNAGGLTLSFSLSDGNPSDTTTLFYTDPSVPDKGTFFGIRDGISSGSTTTGNVSYSNYTLSVVPEPASLSLLSLGAIGLLGRRRRTS